MAGYALSERALQDLQQIDRYTRDRWGRVQAEEYRRVLRGALENLARSPGIGRPRPDIAPATRSFRIGNHIAFYRETETGIAVARILHPSMDAERNLR